MTFRLKCLPKNLAFRGKQSATSNRRFKVQVWTHCYGSLQPWELIWRKLLPVRKGGLQKQFRQRQICKMFVFFNTRNNRYAGFTGGFFKNPKNRPFFIFTTRPDPKISNGGHLRTILCGLSKPSFGLRAAAEKVERRRRDGGNGDRAQRCCRPQTEGHRDCIDFSIPVRDERAIYGGAT